MGHRKVLTALEFSGCHEMDHVSCELRTTFHLHCYGKESRLGLYDI